MMMKKFSLVLLTITAGLPAYAEPTPCTVAYNDYTADQLQEIATGPLSADQVIAKQLKKIGCTVVPGDDVDAKYHLSYIPKEIYSSSSSGDESDDPSADLKLMVVGEFLFGNESGLSIELTSRDGTLKRNYENNFLIRLHSAKTYENIFRNKTIYELSRFVKAIALNEKRNQ